jgi:hypothetical protein
MVMYGETVLRRSATVRMIERGGRRRMTYAKRKKKGEFERTFLPLFFPTLLHRLPHLP